jgi:hypothetical protein
MLDAARTHGCYAGPDTPTTPEEELQLAKALQRPMRAAGTPDPLPGTEPLELIRQVLAGLLVLPCVVETAAGANRARRGRPARP